MRLLILALILTRCINGTIERSLDNLSLNDVGQKLNGHWRLKETETKGGQRTTSSDLDKLEFFEFDGLNGMNAEMTDNHDGSFSIPTCQPACRLKEEESKKVIEYIGLVGWWELEIVTLSNNELVLSDSDTKWTYERRQVREW